MLVFVFGFGFGFWRGGGLEGGFQKVGLERARKRLEWRWVGLKTRRDEKRSRDDVCCRVYLDVLRTLDHCCHPFYPRDGLDPETTYAESPDI